MRLVGVSAVGRGWVRFLSRAPGPDVAIRCVQEESGRLVVRSILIECKSDRVTAGTLRDVPVGRLEALVNSLDEVRERLLADIDEPDPVASALREWPFQELVRDDTPRTPLGRPGGQDPDEFYRRVADAYLELSRSTSKPAVAIAAEADVPVATARRWIFEARRRGALPPGQRGRAS
jgi:hypothetical protein